jgi:hypothetical protein
MRSVKYCNSHQDTINICYVPKIVEPFVKYVILF